MDKLQKVLSVNGRLQAAVVQDTLEQAGLQVSLSLSRTGGYMDICVPEIQAMRAAGLLNQGCFYTVFASGVAID
jgi:hypothetical protein